MDEHLDFLIDDAPREDEQPGGLRIPWSVVASFIVHVVFAVWVVLTYHPVKNADVPAPMVQYVELMRQQPKNFTEAPGKKVETAPITAPFSDANRKAAMPKPTGDTPTQRPGESEALYVPHTAPGDGRRAQAPSPAIRQQAQQPSQQTADGSQQASPQAQPAPSSLQPPVAPSSIQPFHGAQTASAGAVNLRQAIREVSKVASLGGDQGLDLGNGGGEKGYASEGPLSFETQWYDWGEYAEGMVNRIRVNWYEQMPTLIRTGLKGVVTIRFTIHRDGHISDVTILSTSTIPPYDFAAKKAIELSSPLNPLPKDFPNDSERVTAMFYYNSEPSKR
jgi:TonB family protein